MTMPGGGGGAYNIYIYIIVYSNNIYILYYSYSVQHIHVQSTV